MWSPQHPTETQARQRQHAARRLVQTLQQNGHETYWAGGCVRDALLGRTPVDYDIATSALPETVVKIFPRSAEVGRSFGVVTVPFDGCIFEVATFRADHGSSDGRHPDAITFTTAEEDAQRRDFTVNAMFFDPVNQSLHDFVGGQADLQAHRIRCVGSPEKRFREDHLRMLRAVRFAQRLAFDLDPHTAEAIRDQAPSLASISTERIRDEFTRTLLEAVHPGQALWMLENLGLLPVFLPEVSALKHQPQPPDFHPEGDVFTHTAIMLDDMQVRTPTILFAVLLHDIAKPATATYDGTRIRFHGHAALGADMARDILLRLRVPNRIIEEVCHCVRGHMRFMEVKKMRRSTLRKMLGHPQFEAELELHRLDCRACHGLLDNYTFARDAFESFSHEPVLPEPWIRGHDLIQLGVKPGPKLGKLLQRAYDLQLEGSIPNREKLLQFLRDKFVS